MFGPLETALKRPLLRVPVAAFILLSLCLLTLALVGYLRFGSLTAAASYMMGSRLLVDATKKSLPAMAATDQRVVEFRFTNMAGYPVVLQGAQTSCSCVVANDLPFSVPAGKSRSLQIRVGPMSEEGGFKEVLTIYSNYGPQRAIKLIITGSVSS